ncbi:MAG: tetratricopeptide repeat protein [Deltaproteobacteria bacterium]|nr:tetratricopeptide repeat protein [Deltaproteobacteria bacterium]
MVLMLGRITIFALMGGVLTAGTARAETAREAAEKLAKAGDGYAKQGDAKLAVMAYRRAIDRDATFAPPYAGIGYLLLKAGEKREAAVFFDRYLALETRPSEAANVARVNEALAGIRPKAAPAPAPVTAPAAAGAPAPAPAADFNAKAPSRKDPEKKASSLGVSAPSRLTSSPTPATASSLRDADQLFRRRDYKAAAAAYQKLAAASKTATEPRFKLAVALTALARWKEALAAWDDVLAVDPKNAAARLYRERVAEKAAKVIDAALLPADDAVKRAAIALGDGSPSLTLRLTGSVLATTPDRADALILRARAFAALGRFDDAVTAVRRALSQNPGDPRAHFALGETHRALGERDKARAAFLRFLAIVDATDANFARDIAFARRYVESQP